MKPLLIEIDVPSPDDIAIDRPGYRPEVEESSTHLISTWPYEQTMKPDTELTPTPEIPVTEETLPEVQDSVEETKERVKVVVKVGKPTLSDIHITRPELG